MKKITRIFHIACLIVFANVGLSYAQGNPADMPRLIEKDGRYALLVDGEPFFMFGGQSGNSSTWPKVLPNVWDVMTSMHANTLEIPIYWEQVEPEPGKYDFSMVQMLLDQAREKDIRLVLLWFATWKNGSNHYMPEWMKKDAVKYPNIIGKDGKPVDSPSPHATVTMEADAKAFTEVMKYLKQADPQHTVILVQVQNEPGSWGSVRDYSKTAQKLFEQAVPEALLTPEVLKALNVSPGAKGTWTEVFGKNADEYFQAWSVASYIEYVAATGKAVNPLPMYGNVPLRDPNSHPPA
ncbi:MAG: beta-galactosidase, partial [Bacteroidales bacterium]|nr:beta-galactosidase [Bacteroidales bacterium]